MRFACDDPQPERGLEIVEINLYDPADAASVREDGRIGALGCSPVKLLPGESITVDFGHVRSPLGALIEWGETYGTVFSTHLSDDGDSFREMGRITTGNGGSDSFWWRSTTSRYLRLTVHEANSPEGAVVNELKLRILNKDRMPIGQLERAALAGRGDLYPQSLLGRQVYWTALGEYDRAEEALFDEYGNLEPRRGSAQITPLLRVGGALHGAPSSLSVSQSLVDGSLPIPTVAWSAQDVELRITALAHAGEALAEYRMTNRSDNKTGGRARPGGAPGPDQSVLATWRPRRSQRHRGRRRAGAGQRRPYAAFSVDPDATAIADFDDGDVIKLIEKGPRPTVGSLRSKSALLSAACEFSFSLAPGGAASIVLSTPMRDDVTPHAEAPFDALRERLRGIGGTRSARARSRSATRKSAIRSRRRPRSSSSILPLLAFKPGPRNYDRTWIRDGSAQALALLWAGLIDEAKDYVVWYSKRIYENGLVPPILNVDGTVNRGYGSDIEFDAQGEFVGIAADVYRVSRDRAFLSAIFEPVVRATKFIEELCARTDALARPGDRFHGLLAPSISHEGYSNPSYSYWDDYFALSALAKLRISGSRNRRRRRCRPRPTAKGRAFAANLARSIRMTAARMETGLIPGSADRDDVDPSSTSIAFEPCQVEDVLPAEFIAATYDRAAARLRAICATDFQGNFTPYELRNLNAFVSLGRYDDAFRWLSAALTCRRPRGWRSWAEVVWSDLRAPDYIGDMPHTWIGAEFITAIRRMLLRENGGVLELFRAVPDAWWEGEGITLRDLPTAFGIASLEARRDQSRAVIVLALSGPAPDRITIRYPGAKQARADGKPCEIHGDVISAPESEPAGNRLLNSTCCRDSLATTAASSAPSSGRFPWMKREFQSNPGPHECYAWVASSLRFSQ